GCDRDNLAQRLDKKGIATAVHYPRGLHQQPIFEKLYGKSRLPHTEDLARKILALPVHHGLGEEQVSSSSKRCRPAAWGEAAILSAAAATHDENCLFSWGEDLVQYFTQFGNLIRLGNNPHKPIFLKIGHYWIIEIAAGDHALYLGIDLQKSFQSLFAPHAAGNG